jgi:hypothetical protein
MKPTVFCLLLLAVVSVRAQDRVLLARFELKDVAGEKPAGSAAPSQVVAFYRSALGAGPMSEFVEIDATLGDKTSRSRLSNAAAGRLLDLFESVSLPSIDYQKHFEALTKVPASDLVRELRERWGPDHGVSSVHGFVREGLLEGTGYNRLTEGSWAGQIAGLGCGKRG